MTTYGAYDAGLPCKNPSCKSHGRPHPNCKCYPGLAEGGEITHFCAENRPHLPDCEYFADGGLVDPAQAIASLSAPQITPEQHLVGAVASMGAHKILDRRGHDGETFEKHAKHGHKKINAAVKSLFGGDAPDLGYGDAGSREKLRKYVDDGAVTNTLKIAEESPHALSLTHPTENMLLSAAKGRIAQYLTNLKPQTYHQKLAFDDAPDQRDQERRYEQALDLANAPLGILKEVQDGTIEPDHVKHLTGMYPELHNHLGKKFTEEITKQQMAEEKPPYHVRQGLSMLMGTALSSELTPFSIQTAQSVFAKPQPQTAAPAGKPKKSTSSLAKSDQAFLTNSQALQKRSQASD